MSAFDDDPDDGPDQGGTDPDNYPNSPLGSDEYVAQFQEMMDRFNDWADANGFDKATNLDEAVEKIIDNYNIQTGDFSGFDDFKMPSSLEPYSLLERPEQDYYHLTDPVDPRAFDFAKLEIFAWDRGYRVTSSLEGTHGEFSFHTDGRAVDISVQGLSKEQIEQMKADFATVGVREYDETDKSKWTENTTGYHLHVDTGTQTEVQERLDAKAEGFTREDIGLSPNWPLRIRP